MTADTVPNIRFNVAISLEAIIPVLPATAVTKHVLPTLTTLTTDRDADVIFYSKRALAVAHARAREAA
jgi:serine/threonine-protein phosphatase 2A regulatory subunit A